MAGPVLRAAPRAVRALVRDRPGRARSCSRCSPLGWPARLAARTAAGRGPARSAAGDHQAAKHEQEARARRHKQAAASASACGQPPRNYVIPADELLQLPQPQQEGAAGHPQAGAPHHPEHVGRPPDPHRHPAAGNGSIRIATWSFDDWAIARALVAARKRGVSVQVVAAKGANRAPRAVEVAAQEARLEALPPGRTRPRARLYSFARQCRGSCRGPGGTPHSKYFLFDNVGARHARNVAGADLGEPHRDGLPGAVEPGPGHALGARLQRLLRGSSGRCALRTPGCATPTTCKAHGQRRQLLLPAPRATARLDPVDADPQRGQLPRGHGRRRHAGGPRSGSSSTRSTASAGSGSPRGCATCGRPGCNVAIIYSVSSRPVLSILRNHSGRGPVPMRQSVVKDSWGNIVKYNHSKWMTITGRWGRSRRGLPDLQRVGQLGEPGLRRRRADAADPPAGLERAAPPAPRSPRPGGSRPRTSPGPAAWCRSVAPPVPRPPDVPEDEPAWGQGVFKYIAQCS